MQKSARSKDADLSVAPASAGAPTGDADAPAHAGATDKTPIGKNAPANAGATDKTPIGKNAPAHAGATDKKAAPTAVYKIIGEPEDLASAIELAKKDNERYQFQWWALSLVKARPLGASAGSKEGKKGSDKGIDGVIPFFDDKSGKSKRFLVQVKSGKVRSGDIRDLVGTVRETREPDNEQAKKVSEDPYPEGFFD